MSATAWLSPLALFYWDREDEWDPRKRRAHPLSQPCGEFKLNGARTASIRNWQMIKDPQTMWPTCLVDTGTAIRGGRVGGGEQWVSRDTSWLWKGRDEEGHSCVWLGVGDQDRREWGGTSSLAPGDSLKGPSEAKLVSSFSSDADSLKLVNGTGPSKLHTVLNPQASPKSIFPPCQLHQAYK